jgi:DNA-binding transcriptional ArsR family regulator
MESSVRGTRNPIGGRAVDAFLTLGDPKRLGILAALRNRGLLIREIAGATGYRESSIYYHVEVLRRIGAVESRRESVFTRVGAVEARQVGYYNRLSLTGLGHAALAIADATGAEPRGGG